MNLSNNQKQVIVSKIRKSKTLKNAPTSNALLQYLHDATLKGVNLKEGVIDIEFFGSKEPSDKNNPRVRVNVYNLRKKINQYYETEGQNDAWQLIIDKGQYEVGFVKKTESKIKNLKWPIIIPYGLLLLFLLLFTLTNLPIKTPKIWKAYLSKNTPANLFIGDHFGVVGQTATGGYGWTRDFDINSSVEFYKLLENQPELKLKPANYTYTTRMAALATQQFQQLFQKYNHSLPIRFSTRTSISEIKEGNAVYAGPLKNKNSFLHFFNQAHPHLNIKDHNLYISKHPTRKDSVINLQTKMVDEEYAIVSNYPSVNNTHHFVFFSEHDIGVSATAEFFTNSDSIQHFTNAYLKNSEYFTALFKVKGQNRTNTDLKLEMVIPF